MGYNAQIYDKYIYIHICIYIYIYLAVLQIHVAIELTQFGECSLHSYVNGGNFVISALMIL